MINPEITDVSEEVCLAWEGCISDTKELCLVERPQQVKVRFNDIRGKEYDLICMGLMARVFLHEIDHLQGRNMWDPTEEDETSNSLAIHTQKRLERTFPIAELHDEENYMKFCIENKNFIFEY